MKKPALKTTALPSLEPQEDVGKDVSVHFNIRVRQSTSESLAARAQAEGVTMKTIAMRALQAAGVNVALSDLEDYSPKARRIRALRG